jgi:hypothetical protein
MRISLDNHSSLTERTHRSADAFRFGLRAGSFRDLTPAAIRIDSKGSAEFGVAVVQHIAEVSQTACARIGYVCAPSAPSRLWSGAVSCRDGDTPAFQMNEE